MLLFVNTFLAFSPKIIYTWHYCLSIHIAASSTPFLTASWFYSDTTFLRAFPASGKLPHPNWWYQGICSYWSKAALLIPFSLPLIGLGWTCHKILANETGEQISREGFWESFSCSQGQKMVPLDTVRTRGKLHTEESPSKPHRHRAGSSLWVH